MFLLNVSIVTFRFCCICFTTYSDFLFNFGNVLHLVSAVSTEKLHRLQRSHRVSYEQRCGDVQSLNPVYRHSNRIFLEGGL